MITLITGGARSGKTSYAEKLAAKSGCGVIYLATAAKASSDIEMRERIRRHRADRPIGWATVEESISLGATLRECAHANRCVIIDCLTLWLSNLLLADGTDGGDVTLLQPGSIMAAERAVFLDSLRTAPGSIVVISNEIGMGVVPLGALNRCFVDEAGRLNQEVAALSSRVIWMVAGCPVMAKGAS